MYIQEQAFTDFCLLEQEQADWVSYNQVLASTHIHDSILNLSDHT